MAPDEILRHIRRLDSKGLFAVADGVLADLNAMHLVDLLDWEIESSGRDETGPPPETAESLPERWERLREALGVYQSGQETDGRL